MGIDTKILFLSVLQSYVEMIEMAHFFFEKNIEKKLGTIFRNIYLHVMTVSRLVWPGAK